MQIYKLRQSSVTFTADFVKTTLSEFKSSGLLDDSIHLSALWFSISKCDDVMHENEIFIDIVSARWHHSDQLWHQAMMLLIRWRNIFQCDALNFMYQVFSCDYVADDDLVEVKILH